MLILNKNKNILTLLFNLLLFSSNCSGITTEVEEVFKENEIIPDVISVGPNDFLEVTYENGVQAEKGIELTPTKVKTEPKLKWDAEKDAYYTIILTDPDAPSRSEPKFREFKHWVIGNVKGNDVSSGEVIAAYIGAGPPKGTGLHRYIFLVYKQPSLLQFDEERVANNSRQDRPKFKAADFAKKYDLGHPVAGNFFQAQYDDYVPILHKQLSEN